MYTNFPVVSGRKRIELLPLAGVAGLEGERAIAADAEERDVCPRVGNVTASVNLLRTLIQHIEVAASAEDENANGVGAA